MRESILSGTRASVIEDHFEIVGLVVKQRGITITPKEKKILAAIAESNDLGLLTSGVRNKIRRQHGFSPAAFSNHTARLREKGLLIEEAGDLRIHPKILPEFPSTFQLKLHARADSTD